jgi:hypothetical protein
VGIKLHHLLQEKKYFTGQLNADALDILVGEHETVNMENCRFGSTNIAAGAVGSIESIGSTIPITTPLWINQNFSIGSCWDEAVNRILFFIWNSEWHHRILCWDIARQTMYTVLLDEDVTGGLNFSKNSLIHSCYVLSGLLFWTDNLNPPRRLNIEAGINAYAPGYSAVPAYSLPVDQTIISWIRRPPSLPLGVGKVIQTIPALENNFIRYSAQEFTYRYQFRDKEYSTLAPYSLLMNYNRTADTFNRIDITVPLSEKIAQDVQQVDIVQRPEPDGDPITYFVIKSWNKNNPADAAAIAAHNSGATALSYAFYNNQSAIALDSAYAVKPFDSVPLLSQTVERAKDRSFMANNLMGYTAPLVTSLVASIPFVLPPAIPDTGFKSDASYQLSVTFYDNDQRKSGIVTQAQAIVNTPDRTYGAVSSLFGITWNLSNAAALVEIPDWAYSYSVNITKCLRTRFFIQTQGRDATYVQKDVNGNYTFNTSAYTAVLAGCAFDISLLNSSGMGYTFAQGDIIKIYIGSNVYSLSITGQQGVWVITELQNLGTLNGSTPFLFEIYTPYKALTSEPHFEVTAIYPVTNPTLGSRAYSTLTGILNGDIYFLKRNGLNTLTYNIPTATTVIGSHTVGCNFVSQTVSDPNYNTGNSPLAGEAGFDVTTDNSRWIQKVFANPMNMKAVGTVTVRAVGTVTYELFLVLSNGTKIQLVYPTSITNAPQTVLTFDVDFSVPANTRVFILAKKSDESTLFVYFNSNFTFSYSTPLVSYTVEAMSPNDKFYKNWNTHAGRPNFIDTKGQIRLSSRGSFSNTLLQSTNTNGLSTFDALDVFDVPAENGAIQRIILTSKISKLGTIMLAICSKETVSIYLGEVQVAAPQGDAFLAQATGVIGTIYPLKGGYGTRNPESAVEFRGNVYWLSADNGKVIQYSDNGLFPVSNYKITKFWKLFSDTYIATPPATIEAFGSRPFVFFGIDPHHEELLASVPQVLANPPLGYLPDYPTMVYPFDIWDGRAKAIVYKLATTPNKWQGAYNIPAEGFVTAQDDLYAFKNGTLHKLNSATGFGNFFGTLYKSRIMFISNALPNVPKSYERVSVETNEMLPQLIYFRSEIPFVQASEIVSFAGEWALLEGMYYALIRRDKLTPGNATGLINGDKMRTHALRVLMEWVVTTAPLQFRFVNIDYNISRGHKTMQMPLR